MDKVFSFRVICKFGLNSSFMVFLSLVNLINLISSGLISSSLVQRPDLLSKEQLLNNKNNKTNLKILLTKITPQS